MPSDRGVTPASAPRARLLGWWHIPLFSGLCIAVFFVAWEVVEMNLLADVPAHVRRWLYVGRGVFGAACIGVVTGILVRRHERRVSALRHAVARSEKLAAVGQVAAGVAHEIGNPLASMSCIVQLLQRGSLAEADAARVETLSAEINRIQNIVRQMVDFARPAASEPTLINLADVLHDTLALARYDPRARRVRFDRRLAPALPPVRAVRDHLVQVFLNVLSNALDAMPDGGVLTIQSAVDDGRVVVDFQDSGPGIPPEQLDRLFTPFFSTKPAGRGTGLGLAVTRTLLEQHRGRISVDSRPGNGTRVRISLPAADRSRPNV